MSADDTTTTTEKETTRPGPFRALLWKEWRQQRWTIAALVAASVITLLALLPIDKWAAYGGAMLFWLGLPVIVGCSVFCAEEDDRTVEFMNLFPLRHASVYWLKAFAVLVITCAAALVLMAELLPVAAVQGKLKGFNWEAIAFFVMVFLWVCAAALLPAIVSVLARRTISSVIATIVAICALAGYVALFTTKHLQPFGWFASEEEAGILSVFIFSMILLGGRWLWSWGRVSRTTWAKVLRVALCVVVFCVVVASPVVVRYVHVTFFAPLGFFVTAEPHHVVTQLSRASADGRYITMDCATGFWGYGSRVAVLDTLSGESYWVSRFRATESRYIRRLWSPSSQKLLVLAPNRLLLPFRRLDKLRYDERYPEWDYWIIRADTNTLETLDSLCPDLTARPDADDMYCCGWWDENRLILYAGTTMYFADTSTGKIEECPLGHGLTLTEGHEYAFWPRHITARGVFCILSEGVLHDKDKEEGVFRIFRFAPELPQCEEIRVEVKGEWPRLRSVSQSGHRALISSRLSPRHKQDAEWTYLCDLRTGRTVLLSSPPEVSQQGLLEADIRFLGFMGEKSAVLHDDHEIILCGVESLDFRRIQVAPTMPAEWIIEKAKLSPSGKYLLIQFGPDKKVFPMPSLDPSDAAATAFSIDLLSGESWPLYVCDDVYQLGNIQWLGDDRLLVDRHKGMWTLNRDGTNYERLLPKE